MDTLITKFSQGFRDEIEVAVLRNYIKETYATKMEDLSINDEGNRKLTMFDAIDIIVRPFVYKDGLYIIYIDAVVNGTLIEEASAIQVNSYDTKSGTASFSLIKEFSIV